MTNYSNIATLLRAVMVAGNNEQKMPGSTEIRTRIAGFKVQSANHYTIEPLALKPKVKMLAFPAHFDRLFLVKIL